jgi:hypothetical protein
MFVRGLEEWPGRVVDPDPIAARLLVKLKLTNPRALVIVEALHDLTAREGPAGRRVSRSGNRVRYTHAPGAGKPSGIHFIPPPP